MGPAEVLALCQPVIWALISHLVRRNLIASEHVKIALRVTNAGSKRETGWHAEGNVDMYQFGSLSNGEYLPLYQLQTIQTKRLGPSRDGVGDETETL
jgi:hypothetical protein